MRGRRLENNSIKLLKRVAKRVLVGLVKGTPVDKGVARSNWIVSTYNPIRAVIPAYFPGKKLGRGERFNARAAIAAGVAQINLLRVGSALGIGQTSQAVFITNSIPYLGRLRAGYSSQQPNDWVSLVIIEARTEFVSISLLEQ